MAANIFIQKDRNNIDQRLNHLHPEASRLWGTMNSTEMLRHCRAQLDFVLNPPANPKVYKTMLRFGPFRWLALYGPQWPKNSPTAPEMDVRKKLTDVGAFDFEKAKLSEDLNNLAGKTEISAIHPLFGRMGRKDWGRVVWKHLDHHLRQFGC